MVKKAKSKETGKGRQEEVEWLAMEYGQPYSEFGNRFLHLLHYMIAICSPIFDPLLVGAYPFMQHYLG